MAGGKRQKKNDGVKREAFTTNINSDLLQKLRIYCATHNVYQNDVIEELLSNLLEKEKGSENVGDTD